MSPFDLAGLLDKPCPKCGGENIGVNGYRWSVSFRAADDSIFGVPYGSSSPEHLDVACTNCGYSYWMEPADAKEKVST